jgi:hypothetical protein
LVAILSNKEYRESILKLHDYLTTHNKNIEQAFDKLDSENKMTELLEENAYFEVTNFNLSESRNYWEAEYRKLYKNIKNYKYYFTSYNHHISNLIHYSFLTHSWNDITLAGIYCKVILSLVLILCLPSDLYI